MDQFEQSKNIILEKILNGYYINHEKGEQLLNIDLDYFLNETVQKCEELETEVLRLENLLEDCYES